MPERIERFYDIALTLTVLVNSKEWPIYVRFSPTNSCRWIRDVHRLLQTVCGRSIFMSDLQQHSKPDSHDSPKRTFTDKFISAADVRAQCHVKMAGLTFVPCFRPGPRSLERWTKMAVRRTFL